VPNNLLPLLNIIGNNYTFAQQNFTAKPGNSTAFKNETIFSTILPNNAVVNITVDDFLHDDIVEFANQSISVCTKANEFYSRF
jgi:hypothetical protein